MSELARRLEGLSPEKRELVLQTLLKGSGEAAGTAPGGAAWEPDPDRIVPRDRKTPPPLSFGQERLWILDQFDPGNSAYNVYQAFEIAGPLELPVLTAAVREIVRRHECLRTTFALGEPPARDPVQVVRSGLRLDLPLIDFESISPAALQWDEVRKTARRVALRPYDLRTGPLVRVTVIRLAARRHVVILATHHIVSDDWSADVFLGELGVLYHSFARGAPSPLPELAVQYADYAVWQRARLRGARLERLLEFWTERLGDAPRVLELPTDRPRPAAQTFQGGWVSIEWPSELVDEIRVLARRSGTTIYMTVLAAWKALLAQYSGVRDVVVGAPIAGQSRLELEGLIGFFINTLAFRTDLSGNPTFRELVDRVRETTHTAFAHQEMPFEKLVEELQPERDPSRTPLVQVVFNLLGETGEGQQLGALRVTPLALEIPLVMFDLILTLRERARRLTGRLEFASALFDRASMARMAGHLEELVRNVAARPDQRLGVLCVLSRAERAQMLSEWNDTAGPAEERPLLHELFAAQARRRPGAVAVVFAETYWTYRELDRRSNRLARQLRELGVGRGHRVAVLLERSAEMVLALLGTLKSGAAYVPLESRFPEKRMAWILRNMEIGVMLTSSSRLETARVLSLEAPGLFMVCLNRSPAAEPDEGMNVVGWREVAGQSERVLSKQGSPDDLAYVIFTSGSTGLPKGVMVRHRPVVNLIDWANRRFALSSSDRVLFITSLGFDLSVFDVFGMLAAGGSIRVASEEEASDPGVLARTLLEEPVSFWDSAPVALTQLVPFLAGASPQTEPLLRLVFLSGDWIPLNLPDQVRASFPKAQVVALGGATEATVWSNFHPVGVIDPDWVSIPYGRPILNARYYVLSEHLEPVPIGVPGDLYIGGGCLASGYAAAPVQTAWHFLPDPLCGATGAVMYRTGDRSRFRHGGWIEFLGRLDHQVKVRGFRIELGEIEAVLRTHPAVRQGVVLARHVSRWEKRLVAYVVARSAVSVPELREHLRDRLPDYMVPALVVFLEQLPVTANGKLDRAALPDPVGVAAVEPEEPGSPPRDPVEQLLAAIWCEILEVPKVGRESNFFDLGGQSLTATRMVMRLQEVFQAEISLRTIFEHPTLAELATVVDREMGSAAALPPIDRAERDLELELSYAQERLWFLHELDPASPAYNIPVALDLHGRLELPVFTAAWNQLVKRHETLRTRFPSIAGVARQVIEPPYELAWPVIDLGGLPASRRDTETRRLVREEAACPFDLASGPLLRGRLLSVAGEEWVILLTVHHIISDGWSMAILVEELTALYEAAVHSRPSPLPELGIQYADYACWQRRWLESGVLEKELAYWRRHLSGAPATLELPADRPRLVSRTFRGASSGFTLAQNLAERVRELSAGQAVTLFMSLLAALQALLHRWTGETDICVGSPIAGRNHPGVERLIGFFVNTLVLRTGLNGHVTFQELLKNVRQMMLDAYAHQNLPFERLVGELQPERDLGHSPLFQVLFVLEEVPRTTTELPDLHLEFREVERNVAKFDLTLAILESNGRLGGRFDYSRDLFEAATMDRLSGYFGRLLEEMVETPETPVANLDLLTRAQLHQLLHEWDALPLAAPREELVHERFARQAGISPDSVAAVCENHFLSYRELDSRAGRLAGKLRRLGVGPEVRVGLEASRSLEMLVGVWGTLKAGGVYVALDPKLPADRVAYMSADARIQLFLVEGKSRLRDSLEAHRVLELDEAMSGDRIDADPAAEPSAANAAYVLFTSGTTGRPKGVVVEHRQLVSYLDGIRERMELSGDGNWAMVQPLSVDSCVTSLYPPFLGGGCLHVVTEQAGLDARRMSEYFRRHRIDGVKIAPAHLVALTAAVEPSDLLPRKWLVVGGEASRGAWLAELAARPGAPVVFNHYGPTETTVGTLTWRVGKSLPSGLTPTSPVGRPLPATRTRVMDRRLGPVPAGVPGELCIGGDHVTRGYLGRPKLTAERYVPDAVRGAELAPGRRLYRTGDLVRHLAGGELEFLRRLDDQVKVRGFRIELGEIETSLRRHPAVTEAVALLREDPGEKKLLAWVVGPSPSQTPELREFLRRQLPEYMVPAAIGRLDELPRTDHGKLDRRALAAVEVEVNADSKAELPVTPIEEGLTEIWCEVLDCSQVGLDEDFFEAGGDSLLAIRALARIRETFQADLELDVFFRMPTIAQLAKVVQKSEVAEAAGIELAPRDEPLPLSFAQQRLWFLHQLDDRSAAYHIPAAVRLTGKLDVEALRSSLTEILRRHEVLRTTFALVGGEPKQIVGPPPPFHLPVVDLSRSNGDTELHRLLADVFLRPFDMARGPLLRGVLVAEGRRRHVLILNLHHIVSDGWSNGILLHEIHILYETFCQGCPSPLPELRVQYADYAVWQRRWLTGELLAGQVDYWRRAILGSEATARPPVLELPTDRPRPAIQTFRGEGQEVLLPADLIEGVRNVSRRNGTTLFMTTLAVFDLLMHRLSEQTEILTGTSIAGRSQLETENLIGFFVNTLVMRVGLEGDPPFNKLLERVREVCLGAYAHQDLPFEKLVNELRLDRDMSRSPLFQVLFALENTPVPPLRLTEGLALEPLPAGTGTAKFDLTVVISRRPSAMVGGFEYNADLYDATTVARMGAHFRELLRAAVEEPSRRLSEMPLMNGAQRAQLLREWTDTAKRCPQVPMVHELFRAQAHRRPEARAVVSTAGMLSYGELEKRANRLAHHLRTLGVGPEALVALLTGRTLERSVAILAVLKAGGAYVSLDPTSPEERLAFLVDDARAQVLLTEAAYLGALPDTSAEILCLDRDGPLSGDESTPPESSLTPENLAYVVYTSGSTGKPKGVDIPHAGLMNMTRWHCDLYSVTEEDHGTQVASPAFDASIWEFWPYLTAGASSHIPDDETRFSSPAMIRWWADQGITLAYLPTPLAEGVLEEKISPGLNLPTRALIIGGDRLHRGPNPEVGFRLMNHYGPAEYSIVTTVVEVPTESGGTGAVALPTIGRAIDNTQMYVVDRKLALVSIGVPGELYIGGVGLARGYSRRPALTADKFLPDPFGTEPGARFYRTGDQVRYLADGDLDFLGRFDHQIKLRGLRIELGEIEAALTEHCKVREGVVLVREDRPGDKRLVAFVAAPEASDMPSAEELRSYLGDRLPRYMVPSAFVTVPSLPLTANGKVDRRALARQPLPEMADDRPFTAPDTPLESRIADIWADLLGLDQVGVEDNFFDLGGHSMLMARLQHRLREDLDLDFSMIDLFQLPSVRDIAARAAEVSAKDRLAIATRTAERARTTSGPDGASGGVAVIGMAGRFPGARNVGEFWRNLCDGVESIVRFTPEELIEAGEDPEVVARENFVAAAGKLEGVDLFDARFFGLSPRDGEVLDPQQRIFLECAWHALEDAGYGGKDGRGAVGVFAGADISTYLFNLHSRPDLLASVGAQQILISNDKDHLATRTSYLLDLSGPSVSVQTACSTSLVAVHLACQALFHGECDMALAGGAGIAAEQVAGYLYEEGGVRSPDGHCRAFDAAGRGTVPGNGAGVVVLKRVEDAMEDGDPIYAVIRGTAINNDGSGKVGYTAPSIDGQAAVIAEAQEMADVGPESIGYVEAHGSGTRLGDPIEIAALTKVFRSRSQGGGTCAVGSVKTNIGHLDSASGIAGMIKTVLAVHHGQVPPSLHFEQPNPEIDFASSPLYVSTETHRWPQPHGPRRAGVSSFGIGGTNAHVVLEQAPAPPPARGWKRAWRLLPLSAKTESALERQIGNLARYLENHGDLDLDDVSYTLQVGRRRFRHRRFLACRSVDDAIRGLSEASQPSRMDASKRRPVAFLFPGLGDHYVGMGQGLYENEPQFREVFDECSSLLDPHLGTSLREILYPVEAQPEARDSHPEGKVNLRAMLGRTGAGQDQPEGLSRTSLAQPVLFAFEYALARLWIAWGLRPQAMIGYSLGEYVAASLAGVLSLPDALDLVTQRARMIEALPAGAMLAVSLSQQEIAPRLGEYLSLCAINGPETCVVGGPLEEVAELERRLAAEDVACRRLRTTHAFHSRMMDPIADSFRSLISSFKLTAPKLPYISNVTGTWIRAEEASDPDYWVEHLCRPVRFARGVDEIRSEPERILLEVGPGQSLTSLALQQKREDAATNGVILASVRGFYEGQDDQEFVLRTVGRLWMAGAEIDWESFHGGGRRRVHLPTYPFDRQRLWVERAKAFPRPDALVKKPQAEWTYIPSWRRARPLTRPPALERNGRWLLFLDECGVGPALAEELRSQGLDVDTVTSGSRFECVAPGAYRLDPESSDDYLRLLEKLAADSERPSTVVHLWTVTPTQESLQLPEAQMRGFYSLVFLVQAVEKVAKEPFSLDLTVVSSGLQQVLDGDPVQPEKAPVLGLLKVISQEMPGIKCRSVDLGEIKRGAPSRNLIERLLAELDATDADMFLAARGRQRWFRTFEPLALSSVDRPPLRQGGVYLITGGLGNLGQLFAGYLFEQARAKLVLTGRSPLPPRSQWTEWLTTHDARDSTSRRLRGLMALEDLGAEVLVLSADVTDRLQMQRVVAETQERFGTIHGVVHAAGVNHPSLVRQITPEQASRVFESRIEGGLVVSNLFREKELDFLLLFSSLSSVVGGLGLGSYSAAHAFLDALAVHNQAAGGPRTVAVNLGYWQMADEDEERLLQSQLGEAFRKRRQAGMTPSEGLEVLGRILSDPLPQVLVSPQDLFAELQAVEELRKEHEESAPPIGASRPHIDTPYAAPRDEREEALAELWQDLLGIEEVGIHDSFYELGGHSLLAIQMSSRLRARFGVELPLDRLLGAPTVEQLALAIDEEQAEEIDAADLEELLAEIEGLPEEDQFVKTESGGQG